MPDHSLNILEKLSNQLRDELLNDIIPYWKKNTPDFENGGFYGRITADNKPVKDAEKGSILHSRILWTFSACYRESEDPEMKRLADHAYEYLVNAFLDPEYGGIYWMLSSDGHPTDSRKHVYAQVFFIYGLCEYYGATGNEEALKHAVDIFDLINEKCFDSVNGGYFEAFTREWELKDDVRLSEKDENEPKSMNTHLHVLEAYANLYRYKKSKEVEKRLRQLIDIFIEHIVNKDQNSLITFFGEDWTVKSEEISWGHNIEASWLLQEAAQVAGYEDAAKTVQIALDIADNVLQRGQDTDGGLFNESGPEGLRDDNKDWWPQAEAVVGFTNAFQLSGEQKYLEAADKTWMFIKAHILDRKYGEWHEKTDKNGKVYEMDKVRSWKGPYHNSRAALELIRRFDEYSNSQKEEIEILNTRSE